MMFGLHSSQSGRSLGRGALWVRLDAKDLSKHPAIKDCTLAQGPLGAYTEKKNKTMLRGSVGVDALRLSS